MNKQRRMTAETYASPALELHECRVEQGFANSPDLTIKDSDYNDGGPGFTGGDGNYNDLF